jgi:glycosyltransferase involved in cell wall biosynthesis
VTPSVTIVHERFTEFAGSEQVVAQLAQLWPEAAVLAPIAQPDKMPAELAARITSTGLSRFIRAGGGYAHLLPALPLAMRRLPVGNPDFVLASHHAFADQVVFATDAPVIAYVHSPARWVWDTSMRAGEAGGLLGAAGLAAFAAAYRPADKRAAARLAGIVVNSHAVAGRVEDWWQQPSRVVHPPVDTVFYTPDDQVAREDFLLLAGRLVPYKRPGLAIAAARAAGRPIVIAGDGRMRAECERLAGPQAQFVGRVSNEQLRSLFRRCAALLMPGVEDFGIVPVEAQACGAPVIATGAGGALDSVLPGRTGELVPLAAEADAIELWARALADFDPGLYKPAAIRAHADGFSAARFRSEIEKATRNILHAA